MIKKVAMFLVISMLMFNASCGTLTGWNKREPFKGAVIVGNAGLLLLGIIPGVVGFIVDIVNDKI